MHLSSSAATTTTSTSSRSRTCRLRKACSAATHAPVVAALKVSLGLEAKQRATYGQRDFCSYLRDDHKVATAAPSRPNETVVSPPQTDWKFPYPPPPRRVPPRFRQQRRPPAFLQSLPFREETHHLGELVIRGDELGGLAGGRD